MMIKFCITLIFLFPSIADAYLDPGTTGAVFTALAPIIAAILGFLGFFFRPIFRFLKWFVLLIKRNKIASVAIVILLVAGGYIGYGYFHESDEYVPFKGDSLYSKVLFIGIDGMDYNLTKMMLENDELPNLKALSEDGSFMELVSSNPPQSPVAWASIATGANPGKHNIFDFIVRNPENYIPELAISKIKSDTLNVEFENLKKLPPFWQIISDNGIHSEIFRWVGEFPPSETKADVFPGFGVPDIKGSLGNHV